MPPRRELQAFAAVLAALLAGFFSESLFGGKVLSPADVLLASVTFGGQSGPGHEPSNRLLIDPVLQFQPWLEFNRAMLRRGRLPLWNDLAGCGAPHLANGQSAVFDPFHAIAYLGRLPDAYAWMAAARLWVAGLGMFLLARSWRFGGWGRWFAGLTWPFCGFLVVWLLYPVTSAAIWMPWLLLASERLLVRPSVRSASALALCVGLVLLGGHIQTGAHVLLAAGVYALWRWQPGRMRSRWEGEAPAEPRLAPEARQEPRPSGSPPESGREAGHWVSPQMPRGALAGWAGGVLLGVVIGAIAVVPLGFYLARSPVWADRSEARRPAWQLGRPRLLDAVCTAFPYAFGSQRRGHPNLARALGVHNLNESAGGFAGLATLIWLAHAAWSARRSQPRVRFLVGLAGFGAMAAFGLPPVDNLLRALPVLNVTDNRRLTLWLAFGLVMLGGVGIDHLDTVRLRRGWKPWICLWVVASAGMLLAALAVGRARPQIEARAHVHYSRSAAESPGLDPAIARVRAERQVRQTTEFLPRYLGLSAINLLALAALAAAMGSGRIGVTPARAGVLGLVLCDLLSFGFGLNPAISRQEERPASPLIAYLRQELGDSGRALALGAELPPNTLMRYGLADMRNYDSVELASSLAWFAPLYEPGKSKARTSRRPITWLGVLRARDRLQQAGVTAIVSASPPPAGAFERVDRVGGLWVARLPSALLVTTESGRGQVSFERAAGSLRVEMRATSSNDRIVVRETFDPGWRAEVDGRPRAVEPFLGAFLAVPVRAGDRVVKLCYDPPEVRLALGLSLVGLAVALAGVTVGRLNLRKKPVIGLDDFEQSSYNRSCDLHRSSEPVCH